MSARALPVQKTLLPVVLVKRENTKSMIIIQRKLKKINGL